MKTAIIIADGIKQIMFTPENDSERQALKLITLDDENTDSLMFVLRPKKKPAN